MSAFYTFEGKDFTFEEVLETGVDSWLGQSSKKEFSIEDRKESIDQVLKDLAQDYRANKDKIFTLIERTLEKILPKEIKDYFRFAQVETFKLGDTPVFTIKSGKIKAYWVARGGTVRRFRKDKSRISISSEGVQAKVYEEMLRIQAGLVDFNDLMKDCRDAILKEIKAKVHNTLIAVITKMPTPNVANGAGIDETKLVKLIQIVKSYGKPIIYGTYAGLSALPTITNLESDLEDVKHKGYTSLYKGGVPTMELENYVADETNSAFAISDKYLFIIPEGEDKIVKIGFEGRPIINEQNGADWTKEWETLTQVAVAILQYNQFAVYENTDLN